MLRPFALTAAVSLVAGCSGAGATTGKPVPALARTPAAARAFADLRRRWPIASRDERIAYEEHVTALRRLFDAEPAARAADAYLAWILLEKGDLVGARARAAAAESAGPGAMSDLGMLLDGAALSRAGRPGEALARLLPLLGKLIDPYARALLHEESVRAAVATQQWRKVVELLDAWLLDAAEEDQDAVREVATRLLAEVPAPTLLAALFAMKEDDETGASRHAEALEKAIARRLADVALARGDGALARKLLAGGQVSALGAKGAEVIELARITEAVPQVAGRKLGLLVPGATESLRSKGSEATLGVLAALGLVSGGVTTEDRLAVRDDGGSLSSARKAFAALAEAGAAVVVGGLDPEEARVLAELAEESRLPTLLLTPPSKTPDDARWSFVVAPSADASSAAVAQALASTGGKTIAVVGASGALVVEGAARVLPTVDCAAFAVRPGTPRYPIAAWRAQGVDAIVLAGDARCTADVLGELGAARLSPRIGLAAEAASLVLPAPSGAAPGPRLLAPSLVAALGCFPLEADGTPSKGLARLGDERGAAVSWWTVAARDAATMAAKAMEHLPETTAREEGEVARRREDVRQALALGGVSACLGTKLGVVGAWTVVAPKR